MMRIDSHQHFWRYQAAEYGWIGPGMDVLKRDHMPPDLAPLLQASGMDGSVAVQARQTVGETAFLLDLADQYPFIAGVVGWVDLCSPDVGRQIDSFAGRRKLRGVRHVLQDEADDNFALRQSFRRGVGMLAEFGLTYDLLTRPQHLPAAYRLAQTFPKQPFVVDHISKPLIKSKVIEPWASDLRRLATLPNVCCKVSGLATEADRRSWQPSDFKPYLDIVFEAFGPSRLMVGSDWPVCTLAGPYNRVMSLVSAYVRQLSPAEQALVLGETAIRFYGLTRDDDP